MHPLRFLALNGVAVAVLASLLAGGPWLWTGAVLMTLALVFLDETVGDSGSSPSGPWAAFLNGSLYLALPLLAAISALYATYLSDFDPFGLAGAARNSFGIDLVQARQAASLYDLIGGGISIATLYGACGVVVGHEFIHRLGRPVSLAQGYALLGFTCDTTYAVSHVFGHHRNVGDAARDPATARRGETFYRFALRSTWGQICEAFAIEAEHRRRRGKPPTGTDSPVLMGPAIPLVYGAAFAYAAGWTGAAVFVAMAAAGKTSHLAVTYVQHYGLERRNGEPVSAHHSWDSYRAATNALLYNAARHADHHMHMGRPYYRLERRPDAPRLPLGYGAMLALCYVPPVWRRVMARPLAEWDAQCTAADDAAPDEAAAVNR